MHSFVNSTYIYGAPTVFRNEALILKDLMTWWGKETSEKNFTRMWLVLLEKGPLDQGREVCHRSFLNELIPELDSTGRGASWAEKRGNAFHAGTRSSRRHKCQVGEAVDCQRSGLGGGAGPPIRELGGWPPLTSWLWGGPRLLCTKTQIASNAAQPWIWGQEKPDSCPQRRKWAGGSLARVLS